MRLTVWIVIALVVFGGVSTAMHEMGGYDTQVSSSDILTQGDLEQLQESAASTEMSSTSGFSTAYSFIKVVLGALISAISIIPVMLNLGVPLVIAMIFQAPIWIIYGVELACWVRGSNMSL